MTDRKIAPAIAGIACVGLMGAGALAADSTAPASSAQEPSAQELRQEIDALQKQVQKIEAREASTSAQQQTVASILDDAQRRSQMLQAGAVTGGYDGKSFFLSSADGKFVLRPGLQFQFRNATTYRENAGTSDTNDTDNGFEVRRAKFWFEGNAFTKDLTYKFQWVSNRNGGATTPEEMWINYKFSDEFAVRAGQFKDPLNRESLTSSVKLMATERSYQVDIFDGGDNYVQGVQLSYDSGGPVKAAVAFTDGANSFNNNFQDPPLPAGSTATIDADFGVAGRVDYLIFGDWKNVADFAGLPGSKDTLVVGGGVDFSQASQTATGTASVTRYTADALYKMGSGLSLYAGINGRYTSISGGTDSNDFGAVAQVSYAIDNHWEPFARYGYTNFDAQPAGLNGTVHEITGGVNYYLYGQNAKFTVDFTYLPNGAPFADSGADILAGGDNEVVVRGQFQLAL